MKRSLREILADSYIAAVAIVILLFWSLNLALWAARAPLYRAAEFVITAVAIQGIPYSSHEWTILDRGMYFTTGFGLFDAFVSFAAAWLLSHWVHRAGPFKALSECRARFARRSDA